MLEQFGEKAHEFAFRAPEYDSRYTVLTGSVRSSKTWQMMVKLVWLADYKVAGQRVITGTSKETIKQNILNDLFDLIGKKNYSYNLQTGELRIFTSRWRVVGAKDEGSERFIRGATIGIGYSDELTLMPKSFLQMLLSRLSPAGARFYATTNPDNPNHYVKKELIDNQKFLDAGDIEVRTYQLDDNPNLPTEFVEATKRAFSGLFYRRFILGEWVMAEGSIYGSSWDEERNTYDEESVPAGLRNAGGYLQRIVGVDYGTTNPMVFLDVFDDGESLWVDNEYYWDSKARYQQKTDAQYADDLLKFIGDNREVEVVIDPSAASFKAECVARGIYILDANNDVDSGIRWVSTLLSQGKLKFHRKKCPKSLEELPGYSWNDKKASTIGVEEPIKQNDHAPDAIRYAARTKIQEWRLMAASAA